MLNVGNWKQKAGLMGLGSVFHDNRDAVYNRNVAIGHGAKR